MVFRSLGASKSNASWKITPGVLPLDFLARREARTAPHHHLDSPWEAPGTEPGGIPARPPGTALARQVRSFASLRVAALRREVKKR